MSGPFPTDRRPSLETALGQVVTLTGLLVLVGWALDAEALKRVVQGGIAMKANTALGFLLCGLVVLLSAGQPSGRQRLLAGVLASGVLLLGTLSLAQELFGFDLGIDELLFLDPGSPTRISRPGRMSPAAAYGFIAIAAALGLSTMPERFRLQLPLAAALSTSVTVVGAMVLASHVSHQVLGLPWGAVSTLAIHTSLTFLLLGAASLLRVRRLQQSPWALGLPGTAGFVLGVLLMLAAAEVSTSFARDMESTTTQVVQAQQALQQLEEIRTNMRTLESAQRGHLITGDEAFVAGRNNTITTVRAQLALLQASPLGDTLAPGDIAALSQAIEQRLAFGNRLVALRRQQGFEAARLMFNTGEDVALTAAITRTVAPMAQQGRALLARRQQHLREVTTTTFLLLPIGAFLGLTALLSGLFFLDQGFGKRRRAEQALGRSQAQLQVVFDSMSEGVRVIDQQRRILQTNPAGASVHGLIAPAANQETIAGQVQVLTPSGQPLMLDQWPSSRALRGDFVRHCELEVRRRDNGASVVIEFNTAPLPDEPGQPGRIVITSHDVSARRRAEAGVRDSQARLEQVMENLAEGLLIHGLKGEQLHWNRAALAMFELQPHEVDALSLRDFEARFELSTLDGEIVAFDQWPMARLRRAEVLPRLELRVRRLDSRWERVFSYEGALVRTVAGQPLVFLTLTDVTARKTAERQLQQLNAELEQRVAQRTSELQAKTRELESFCYSVSHDLKAPLRGIDGYSRLLADDYGQQLDDEGRMFISNVRQATAQMNSLIEDLLAYSRQERRHVLPTRIALRSFVDNKLARYRNELAGVELELAVEDCAVLADREGMAMALRNLIDNALKFSARASPPRIQIRSQTLGTRCVLSVQDNGTGFDMRYHHKIFEIFQRLHRAEDYPGTGVGLALVRKAMERMGGRVWADSRPGEGATFHLEFERADSVVPAHP